MPAGWGPRSLIHSRECIQTAPWDETAVSTVSSDFIDWAEEYWYPVVVKIWVFVTCRMAGAMPRRKPSLCGGKQIGAKSSWEPRILEVPDLMEIYSVRCTVKKVGYFSACSEKTANLNPFILLCRKSCTPIILNQCLRWSIYHPCRYMKLNLGTYSAF